MFSERISKIRAILKENQAALITDGRNRLYFSGFSSSAGAVLITPRRGVFLIDFRYFEKAKQTVKHLEVMLSNRLYGDIAEILKKDSVTELIVESENVTLSSFARITAALDGVSVSSDAALSQKITELRQIKNKKELDLIKQAQVLTDKTFSYILERITPARTEREIMLDMEFFIRKEGSEGVAFDFIVVSGKNSSLPHGVPTDKQIQKGDFVTMDFGAVIGGYRSDMTRTVAVGHADELQREVYNTVLSAQKAALDFVNPNVRCCDLDKVARDIISKAGYSECFGHGLGHSVGLEVHESPACNTRDTSLLKEGMIMTIEPGIYIEDRFGVRIEDMVYITADSYENLTASEKRLIIL